MKRFRVHKKALLPRREAVKHTLPSRSTIVAQLKKIICDMIVCGGSEV